MISKTIKFTDLDGKPLEEMFWFNIAAHEAVELEVNYDNGSFAEEFDRVLKEDDRKGLVKVFTTLIKESYGRRHPDGRQFIKSEEIFDEFRNTDAYDELFMELLDPEAFSAFVNAVIPQKLLDKMKEIAANAEEQEAKKEIDDIDEEKLLLMSEEDFDKLAGTKQHKWSKRTLTIATKRKLQIH